MLKDIDLYEVRDQRAKTLSGGQKRKLSVAIALIGDSKIVMLDEPTSGMDTAARRRLWEMLKKNKAGRIVILTTHYMDEAEVLGDRIGIMHAGRLTTLGSSLFLKNKFGVGYNLSLVTEKGAKSLVGPWLNEKLGEGVTCLSSVRKELVYQLSSDLAPKFPDFYRALDKNLAALQVKSYGISITTLEEVFLRIGHIPDPLSIFKSDTESSESLPDIPPRQKLEAQKQTDLSFGTNLKAVVYKQASSYRRNKKSIFRETIYPAFVICYGVVLTQFSSMVQSESQLLDASRIAQE